LAHVEHEEDAQNTHSACGGAWRGWSALGGVEGDWLEHLNLLDDTWRRVKIFMELFSVALELSTLDLVIGGFIH
jgi:hypothetical protein